jgi:hypothetical protein
VPHHVVSVRLGHEAGPAFDAQRSNPQRVTFGARLTVRAPESHRQVTDRIAALARGRKQPTAPPRCRTGGDRGRVQVMASVGSLTS